MKFKQIKYSLKIVYILLKTMKVCIGGTFDILHKGHKLLIGTAFKIAEEKGTVFIGLATDYLLKNKKNVKTFEQREGNLRRYLTKQGLINNAIIKSINDKYGPTLNEDFDVIVVSPETTKTAEEINIKRRKKGKKPLRIVQIPFVNADDNKPISTTRIKNKEIDENGKILKSGD